MFETIIDRTTLPVRFGNSLIEIALDHGQIRTGRHRQSVNEIELELKTGNAVDLARLARKLARRVPVSYSIRAKSERGYALTAEQLHEPVEATDIVLSPNASVADAFTAIGLSCLDHLVGNAEAVCCETPGGVHQMRVGLRRLRAAISLFKDVVHGGETERIKTDLGWLAGQLGPARDLDVLVSEGLVPLRKANPRKREIALLEADVRKRRHSGFRKAKATVQSDRYRRIILQTALWIVGGEWLRNPDSLIVRRPDYRIDDYASMLMASRTKKVVKKLSRLKSLSARRRHKLRIAVKKLRYATEFFESVLKKEKSKNGREDFNEALKALQFALGKLNDIIVHKRIARIYGHPNHRDSRGPAKIFAMGILAGHERGEAKAYMAEAVEAGKRIKEALRYG